MYIRFRSRAAAVLMVCTSLFLPTDARAADPAPSTPPATGSREHKVQKLLDYLETDYAKKAVAPSWITRAMGVVSLSRSPRPQAATKLFDILDREKQEVVRLLAWQALLARAAEMDAKNFTRFAQATLPMAEKDLFRGPLRVPLLQVLACTAPSPRSKKIWEKLFADCSSWEPEDIPVLDALGACLASWRSPRTVDGLITLLNDTNMALRAEIVLRRAGSPVRTTISTLSPEIFDPLNPKRVHPSWSDMWQETRREHEKWWAAEKPKWKETIKPEGSVWDTLRAKYIPSPPALDAIDPDDKLWYNELELGQADLSQFEAAFVVDATGSMGDVLAWLKRDLGRMGAACQLLCKEPVGIGVTFYRDYTDPWTVKFLPLTTRLQTLEPDIAVVTADGGGDIPEAILPALKDTVEKNKWSKRAKGGSKVIVLIGDAPPHARDLDAIMTIARKCPENGIKIHAARVQTDLGRNDLSTFADIARAGGGTTVEVEFHRPITFRFLDPVTNKDIPYRTIERPEAQLLVAGAADAEPPGEKILTLIITDMINPQYRDRVEPLAKTLLAFCAKPGPPEARRAFPANTIPLNKMNIKPQ